MQSAIAEPKRKLAAIMFVDIVGYTALMQENEKNAKSIRDKHRLVLKKEVEAHLGNILQFYGDGSLSIFDSSIEAIRAAIKIQQNSLGDEKVYLRVGIHSGDVVHDTEGAYGDGVNVASRIESLAIAGSVLISDKVYDDIKNHLEFTTHFLGSYNLKNVKKPVGVYALKASGLILPKKADIEGKIEKTYKSVAVLPFVNMSSDVQNEYFSDGITEEIINALTRIDGMKITSRTSSFAFKGKNEDIREIGNQLNVDTILEGSVRKSGRSVRITAQLINSADGYHFWSETFDRELEDIFALQDEISESIAKKLQESLGSNRVKDSRLPAKTTNYQAYNNYLKGQHYAHKLTPQDLKKAITYYEKALELDDEYAQPLAALSYCYGFLGITGQIKLDYAKEQASKYAERAFAINENLYETQLIIAMSALFFGGDFEKAYHAFQRAFELNPGAAEVHHYYAIYLLTIGNPSEAENYFEKAIELDPLSLQYRLSYANVLMAKGLHQEAINLLSEILELDPNTRGAHEGMGWAYFFQGKMEESLKEFNTYQKMTDSPLKGLTGLGYVHAQLGHQKEVDEILAKMEQRQKEDPNISLEIDFAVVYAGMGDAIRSADRLSSELQRRSAFLYMLQHPMWNTVRDHPYFQKVVNNLLDQKNIHIHFTD